MKIVKKKIIGCYEILPQIHDDKRGLFVKTFHAPTFKKFGSQVSFKEQYYSTSSKNVIRGLHFQIPPKDHAKLIYCTFGEVADIVLDMRVGFPSYKNMFQSNLALKKVT
jgi:dTDP-4-dehydrorhamnose 3,5-epimerase